MFKFKTISQKTRRVMSEVALGNLSNINFEESCCEKIKTLTNKDEVKICSSGNNGIFITLSAIKGDIIVPDQGGWHGFKQIAKFLDKNVITLKTDSGLIEPNYIDDLDIKEDSALSLNGATCFPAYTGSSPSVFSFFTLFLLSPVTIPNAH